MVVMNAVRRSDKDRRQRQGERFARILRALREIQTNGATVNELATLNDCTTRTVHRDIDVMRRAGEPIVTINGRYVFAIAEDATSEDKERAS